MSHVFQCKDPVVTSHRQDQLQTFYDYLDEQELPTPVRQCIFAGVLGWLGSTEAKPALKAPTRGKVMPADQLATRAFVDQTMMQGSNQCLLEASNFTCKSCSR